MNFFQYIITKARIFTLLVILLPIVAGIYAYGTLPKEGEPEVSSPIALVITTYPGASPLEVESLITTPLEEALSGLKNIKEIRSSSYEGVSVVVVEFDIKADLEPSLQRVREKVTEARAELPDEADDPKVEEITLSDLPIMIVSIVGELEPVRLKRLAEDVADEIELMPEVLSADVTGGQTREIQIYLEPERLDRYGLTLLDVYNAVAKSDVNIPGGMVNVDRRRFLLRTMTEIKRVQDYAGIPLISRDNRVVYLGDLARIVDGHDEDVTYSRANGRPSVSMVIKKRAGANILETSQKIRDKLKELEKGFPAGVETVIAAEQAKYIRQTFDIMNNSAISGLVIVIFVLYFAMGLRNSIITSLSIPLSLLLTFILLKVFGLTNNNMVRFALVLCIGLLVDNAIIVVENCYHHFQLGKDRITAVRDGVSEIAMPVISATLTTMAAFLPMLLMTGTVGEYMSFLPKTVTIALASSLIVALMSNVLVLSRFMKQTVKRGRVIRPEDDLRRLKKIYVRGAAWALNHRGIIVLLTLVGLGWAMSMLALGVVKIEMFPDVDFDFIYITVETPPGTEVDVTDRIARQVETIAQNNIPEAVKIVSTIGYKGQSAFEITFSASNEPEFAEVTVELLEGKEFRRASHKEIQNRIAPLLEAIPGAKIRFRPLAWGPPRFAPVVIKVTGPDLEVLRNLTAQVKGILQQTPGAIDIQDDFSDAPPELKVVMDRKLAAALGVPLQNVALELRGATAGLDVRDFRDELDVSKKYNLTVRYAPEARASTRMLDNVKVRSANGALVPLSQIASFEQGPGVNAIRHADRRRVVQITAQNQGRTAVEITAQVQTALNKLDLPPGYEFKYGGDYKDTEESFASLKLAYLIAFLLIFSLLVAQFNSYYQPFAILTALPLSVVGAMIGLIVTGNNFSIMSFVGLVGLSGIVVNDSIVLVDCINQYRKNDRLNIFEATLIAGRQRLRPIISTTLTTMGGILTLTITDELWEGLGVVIIFGIALATVLTLVVVPVMYNLFETLGSRVSVALKGPAAHEIPPGKVFRFSRRGKARLLMVLVLLVQVAVLAAGLRLIGPYFVDRVISASFQAPDALKLGIEVGVFVLSTLMLASLTLSLLLLPGLIGLIVLLGRRSHEALFAAVTKDTLIVATPGEKLIVPLTALSRPKIRPGGLSLVFMAGRRKIKISRIVESAPLTQKISLRKWLQTRPPKRKELKVAVKELHNLLQTRPD